MPFEALRRRAARDAVQLALGDRNQTSQLFVSGDDRASSLGNTYFAPIATQAVEVPRLDSSFSTFAGPRDRVFLKIDAQGFEKRILQGAGAVLNRLVGVQLELSLVRLYDGETSLPDMLRYLARKKLTLHSLEYGFCDPKSGRMLQCDGVFFRERQADEGVAYEDRVQPSELKPSPSGTTSIASNR